MPTYDYRCSACGHELEVFQSIREAALKKCPKCGKSKLERLIGPGAGILFKGGGFYQTDYRSESYKQGESAEKGGGKPASEKSSEKSADKSAAKESKPAKPGKKPG
jgi:putative FmdB family regulatory protein